MLQLFKYHLMKTEMLGWLFSIPGGGGGGGAGLLPTSTEALDNHVKLIRLEDNCGTTVAMKYTQHLYSPLHT